MLENDFPVSEYYKNNIEDAVTITRGGLWWTAVLLIREPRNKELIIGLYRWQKTANGWKARKQFKFKSQKEIAKIFDAVKSFSMKIPE